MKEYWDKYLCTCFNEANRLDQEEFEQYTKDCDGIFPSLLPQSEVAKILDVGCGAGHFLYYLKKKGYISYWGIDISPELVDFVKLNITERVECCDAFQFLQTKVEEYDAIVANDIIEHIPKTKILDFLNLSYQALKFEGTIIIKTGNMSAFAALSLRYIDFTHEIGFTESSLKQVLRVANFHKVKVLPVPSGRKAAVFYALERFLYHRLTGMRVECTTPLIIGIGSKIGESS